MSKITMFQCDGCCKSPQEHPYQVCNYCEKEFCHTCTKTNKCQSCGLVACHPDVTGGCNKLKENNEGEILCPECYNEGEEFVTDPCLYDSYYDKESDPDGLYYDYDAVALLNVGKENLSGSN